MEKCPALSDIFGSHECMGDIQRRSQHMENEDKRAKNWTLEAVNVKGWQRTGEGIIGKFQRLSFPLYFHHSSRPSNNWVLFLSFCYILVHRAVTIALRSHLFCENACFISASQQGFVLCSATSVLPGTWSFMLLLPVSIISHFGHRCHCPDHACRCCLYPTDSICNSPARVCCRFSLEILYKHTHTLCSGLV